MGYTLYWIASPVDSVTFTEWTNAVRTVIDPALKIRYTGGVLVIDSTEDQGEPFYVAEHSSGFCFCKTNRLPYTVDCMMAMILMVEYGLATQLRADGPEGFLQALDAVNALIPLTTYEAQKEYFEDLTILEG